MALPSLLAKCFESARVPAAPPVSSFARNLESFAFVSEESALRSPLCPPILGSFLGFLVVCYAILLVLRGVIGVGTGAKPFSIPRVYSCQPRQYPNGAAY